MRRKLRMLRRIYLSFGGVYFVPAAASLLLVPLLTLRYIAAYQEPAAAWSLVYETMQILLPICSIWWIYFTLKEQIEGEGRELLWVNNRRFWDLFWELFLTWAWYGAHLSACILFHLHWYRGLGPTLLQLLAQSLFFAGFYVLLAGVTENASFTFWGVLSYDIATSFFAQGTVLEKLSILDLTGEGAVGLLAGKKPLIAALGFAALLSGVWLVEQRRAVD